MVQVAVAVPPEPAKVVLEDVQAVTPAPPVTVNTTVPVGETPPVPVTVAVKTMLPPRVVGELSLTMFEVGVVRAPATVATPKVSPDATMAPSARYRINVRRTPTRKFLSLLILCSLRYLLGGSHGRQTNPFDLFEP
jgi:hypothetical protein